MTQKLINCIKVNLGYVESASVCSIVFTTELALDNFMPVDLALKSLAEDMMVRYERLRCDNIRECCSKSILDKDNVFCAKCGTCLRNVGPNLLDFKDLIWGILKEYNDSYGYDGEETDRGFHTYSWLPTVNYVDRLVNNTFIEIEESGECVLALIIQMLHPNFFSDDNLEEGIGYHMVSDFCDEDERIDYNSWFTKLVEDLNKS